MNLVEPDSPDPVRRARGSALMLAAATAWRRVEARAARFARRGNRPSIARTVDSAHRLWGAILDQSLTIAEKSRLTVRIYESSPTYLNLGAGIFAEEEALFGRRLPSAPARVLVGASGTGREAVALAAQGYEVVALEPAAYPAAECRRRLAGRAPVLALSYEQLNAVVLDRAPASSEVDRDLVTLPFDAVLLGCGSLSHVLAPGEHRRLFRALDRLCPNGPILASFLWTATGAAIHSWKQRPGRAVRLGGSLGRAIGRLRGVTHDGMGQHDYRVHRGFAYTFTMSEVEALARTVGRQVMWEKYGERPSQYATFLPASTRQRPSAFRPLANA